jgi:4-amino-4-deoxy-L-arabinose transferase-like glycosyltransferase
VTARRLEVLLTAVVALVLFMPGAGEVPLTGRDEGRFAQASREMLARGDLVVPTFAGVDRYHKPILFYWCCAASLALFGVSPWAARLPSIVAAVAVVAVVAWSARRRWGEGAGALAGLLLAATVVFNLEARACTADMVMVLPTVIAMLALQRLVVGSGGGAAALVFWVAMAAAVLAKGPVAPAVAVATGVGLWAVGREWRRWEVAVAAVLLGLGWLGVGAVVLALATLIALGAAVRSPVARRALAGLRWRWGVPLFLALVLPWVLAAQAATGGAFLAEAIGHHVVDRALTPFEGHGGFPGFFLVTAVAAALPWAGLIVPAVGEGLQRRRRDPVARFDLAWLLGLLVVLEMVETKLVHYWLPAYPAAVLLCVAWVRGGAGQRCTPVVSRVVTALGSLVVAALPVAAALHFGLAHLLPWAVAAALPLVLWGALLWAPWARPAGRFAVLSVAATAATLVLLSTGLLPRLGHEGVAVRAAARVDQLVRPGERIVVHRLRDDELLFSLPLGTVVCRSTEALAAVLDNGRPTLVVTRSEDLEDVVASVPAARGCRRQRPGRGLRDRRHGPGDRPRPGTVGADGGGAGGGSVGGDTSRRRRRRSVSAAPRRRAEGAGGATGL